MHADQRSDYEEGDAEKETRLYNDIREIQSMEDLVKQLPQEIVIHHILARLDYTSWVRAGSVCRAWRRLSRLTPPPPDIPWLWFSNVKEHNYPAFLSLPSTSSTSPRRRPPPLEDLTAIASYRQHLLIHPRPWEPARNDLIIYNPFTGDTFPLPPPPPRAQQPRWGALSIIRPHFDPNSVVFIAAVADAAGAIHTCRIGDHEWTSAGALFKQEGQLNDLIFRGGLLYCITEHRKIVSFDVANHPPEPRSVVARMRQYTTFSRRLRAKNSYAFYHYLVLSCRRELLVVTRYDLVRRSLRCPVFTVHKELHGKLVQVDDLGDEMLFVGRGCSRSTLHRSHAWPSHFFTKNSIYFLSGEDSRSSISLGKFSLDQDGSNCTPAVFHPDQLPSSFRPIWITPVPIPRAN